MSQYVACILCKAPAALIRALDSKRLQMEYEKDVGSEVPADVKFIGYEEYRCSKCDLEFTQPMTPGDAAFYRWITREGTGYVRVRWEHRFLVNILSQQIGGPLKGIDVGCGSGSFIGKVAAEAGHRMIGIDTNPAAAEQAAKEGRAVYLRTIEEQLAIERDFDFVTSFHCLEHVSDPADFFGKLIQLLRPGGHLFWSVPISPTALEVCGFDPRNHPPHHLTRWTVRSLSQLASAFNLREFRIKSPPQQRAARRALFATSFSVRKGPKRIAPERWISDSLLNPGVFLKTWLGIRGLSRESGGFKELALCWARKGDVDGEG